MQFSIQCVLLSWASRVPADSPVTSGFLQKPVNAGPPSFNQLNAACWGIYDSRDENAQVISLLTTAQYGIVGNLNYVNGIRKLCIAPYCSELSRIPG